VAIGDYREAVRVWDPSAPNGTVEPTGPLGFVGEIDELAIYNAALSAGVLADHHALAVPEPAALALLSVATLLGLARRRRR
jgi:hypothetical protein